MNKRIDITLEQPPKASVIIAVYTDITALRCILNALDRQTEKDFEIIVTEDCNDQKMSDFLAPYTKINRLIHLSQADMGWRKTKAVNRAIACAQSEYLIFLDGDCIPEKNFVSLHLANAESKHFLIGRRVDLGPVMSRLMRKYIKLISIMENWFFYLMLSIPLHLDHVRNYEVGLSSRFIHKFRKNKPAEILGCHFSCYKQDMMAINGYNEDLLEVGAEDSDLQWRFEGMSMKAKSIKFLTPVYHLHHKPNLGAHELNSRIINDTQRLNAFVCQNGILKLNNYRLQRNLTSKTNSAKTYSEILKTAVEA